MFCQLKFYHLSWTQPQVWWSCWGVSLTEVAVVVQLLSVRQSSVLTRPSSELLQPAVTEDFAHLPPEQRRKRLQQKLEEICKELQKEVDQRCVCVCVCVSMWLSFCLLITNPVRSGCADMIFMQCTWVCRTLWCLCKCLYCLFSPELCREPISTESHFPLSSLVPLLLSLLSSARPWGRWKMFMRKILKWETLLVWHPKSARQPRI